jgi:acetylornithine/succinyldiaminopimelate/putrescine aminotransferase
VSEPLPALRIARGDNDLVYDESGRAYIDLFSANGTAWLGHANSRVSAAIARQLGEIWNSGAIATPVRDAAQAAVDAYIPATHRLASFFSTGMEAVEFSLRLARVATSRPRLIAFEHAMHGKSLATAALGWDNAWNLRSDDLTRLPFVDQAPEGEILFRLEESLAARDVAAVLMEPMLGSFGGYAASPELLRNVASLCAASGTLLVCDEILTGLGRTGPRFYFESAGISPDVILIGKSLGAGFPVSGVVARRNLEITPRMLPGSTFAGNALAAAAVLATLEEIAAIDVARNVEAIGAVIERMVAPLDALGMTLRGRGALWVLELNERIDVDRFLADVYQQGVAVGNAARFVRLLPALTISLERLELACGTLVAALKSQLPWTGAR